MADKNLEQLLKRQEELEEDLRRKNLVLSFIKWGAGSYLFLSFLFNVPDCANIVRNKREIIAEGKDPPFATIEEAYASLEEELPKLGLENTNIHLYFMPFGSAETIPLDGNGEYLVLLGNARGRMALRHELYHVWCSETEGFTLRRFLWPHNAEEEWNATSYAISENKLSKIVDEE